MYLARRIISNSIHYYIRESYKEGDHYRHRDLLELGISPQKYIVYPGGTSFHINDLVTDKLQERGIDPDPFELEELFSAFVDPEILYRINKFADRHRYRNWNPTSGEMRRQILRETHLFDRRRAHFLRFGQSDQRSLDRSATLYRRLLKKSRDEIEQYFIKNEQILRPVEYKLYIFTIFDLQRFFFESYARSTPEALNEEKLDQHFLKQVCRLDSDEVFWAGLPRKESLPDYLVRYVIMYFDYIFSRGSAWEEYIRNFMNSRRQHIPPKSGSRMTMSVISTVFGVSRAELSAMTRDELKRIFRKKLIITMLGTWIRS